MKKLLIIRSQEQSTWGSCRVISPNLQSCYKQLESPECEVKFFDISEKVIRDDSEKDESFIFNLSETIKSYKPTEIIFVDHLPLATDVLAFLTMWIPYSELPPLVFQLYGDFTFFAHKWSYLGEKLKGHKIKLIVASESQAKLLRFFSESDQVVEQFLFPVDQKEYFFDLKERTQLRSSMNIKEEEKIILYSGRISLQKNVDILINEYVEICKSSPVPTRLWIVGAFDDHGAQFQGVINHEGFMYAKISELLNTLPKDVLETIKFWGQQNKTELRKLKNASDMFMSFSIYHDEDYGMSPAEALACGLPSLLTDWGGYSSFASSKWRCSLVPVALTSYGHQLTTGKIHSFFDKILSAKITEKDREKLSNDFHSEFSINGNVGRLREILLRDYPALKGFNVNLRHYSSAYWSVKFGRELNEKMTPADDNFYSKVYGNYISGKII